MLIHKGDYYHICAYSSSMGVIDLTNGQLSYGFTIIITRVENLPFQIIFELEVVRFLTHDLKLLYVVKNVVM